MFKKGNKNRGVTLIEALFVLGIMAIMIGGIMLLVAQSQDSTKENMLTMEINIIVSIIHDEYGNMNTYSGLSNNIIINSGRLPNRYIFNNNIIDAYNGDVSVVDAGVTDDNTPIFKLTLKSVSRGACYTLTTQNIGNQMSAMTINGQSVGELGTSHPYLTVNEAEKYCQGEDSNILEYTFT